MGNLSGWERWVVCSERQNHLLCNFTLRFSRQNLTCVPLGNFNTSSTFDILKIDSRNFHIHKSFIETALQRMFYLKPTSPTELVCKGFFTVGEVGVK